MRQKYRNSFRYVQKSKYIFELTSSDITEEKVRNSVTKNVVTYHCVMTYTTIVRVITYKPV